MPKNRKNREYTGLERTPASMSWLIGHRARLQGKLEQLRKIADTLPERIKSLEVDLAAVDAVIPLHEVKVDPKIIKGTTPKGPSLAAYGQLTSFLLRVLREAAGEPRYTAEIALQFVRENSVDLKVTRQSEIMDRVKKRLGALASKGLVQRHHDSATTAMGSWSIVSD